MNSRTAQEESLQVDGGLDTGDNFDPTQYRNPYDFWDIVYLSTHSGFDSESSRSSSSSPGPLRSIDSHIKDSSNKSHGDVGKNGPSAKTNWLGATSENLEQRRLLNKVKIMNPQLGDGSPTPWHELPREDQKQAHRKPYAATTSTHSPEITAHMQKTTVATDLAYHFKVVVGEAEEAIDLLINNLKTASLSSTVPAAPEHFRDLLESLKTAASLLVPQSDCQCGLKSKCEVADAVKAQDKWNSALPIRPKTLKDHGMVPVQLARSTCETPIVICSHNVNREVSQKSIETPDQFNSKQERLFNQSLDASTQTIRTQDQPNSIQRQPLDQLLDAIEKSRDAFLEAMVEFYARNCLDVQAQHEKASHAVDDASSAGIGVTRHLLKLQDVFLDNFEELKTAILGVIEDYHRAAIRELQKKDGSGHCAIDKNDQHVQYGDIVDIAHSSGLARRQYSEMRDFNVDAYWKELAVQRVDDGAERQIMPPSLFQDMDELREVHPGVNVCAADFEASEIIHQEKGGSKQYAEDYHPDSHTDIHRATNLGQLDVAVAVPTTNQLQDQEVSDVTNKDISKLDNIDIAKDSAKHPISECYGQEQEGCGPHVSYSSSDEQVRSSEGKNAADLAARHSPSPSKPFAVEQGSLEPPYNKYIKGDILSSPSSPSAMSSSEVDIMGARTGFRFSQSRYQHVEFATPSSQSDEILEDNQLGDSPLATLDSTSVQKHDTDYASTGFQPDDVKINKLEEEDPLAHHVLSNLQKEYVASEPYRLWPTPNKASPAQKLAKALPQSPSGRSESRKKCPKKRCDGNVR